ncbi:MAG: hypothetical protein JWN03_8727 [Nocardia sp.]|uniref:hypothetical protein n=1 Tax=Nocardia sp. TaxID=1821 RepID=UPI0026323E01|nr:hypothetical protein [Nocardia sp.]MCU1648452.1 hypothetical protein [Nocardia sp.]
MKPWEIFGLVLGVAAFCIVLPPLLGWRRDRLWFLGALLLLTGAVALLFVPLPHPTGSVDCGTVLSPRHEWTGSQLCFEPGCIAPDFRIHCDRNTTSRQETIGTVAAAALLILVLSSRTLLRLTRRSASD